MNNFLYCIDSNYNFQAFSSIISLLDKVNERISIYLIHKDEHDLGFIPNRIKNHKNLQQMQVYKFDKKIDNYPNLYDAHVSEATYYRLFCTDYLPQNLETIFYIDADIICVRDPLQLIKEDTDKLIKRDLVISTKTELIRSKGHEEVFTRLELQSEKYFNAGVMNINLSKWKNLKVDFYKLFNELNDKLHYWDQDLLNYIFDGEFNELNSKLNKVLDFAGYEYFKEKINVSEVIGDNMFIHFAGSHKPWSVNGIMCNLSEIYQTEFRKISSNKFHITHKVRSLSIWIFYKNIVNFKFFKIENRTAFLVDFVNSLFQKKVRKNED